MPRELLYVESSALVKLVLEEPETRALERLVDAWPRRVSSIIAAVEVPRAVKRGFPEVSPEARAREVLDGLELIALDDPVVTGAADPTPPTLRSLDAVHLASALSLGDDLGAFVTYDARLGRAASEAGVEVLSPR